MRAFEFAPLSGGEIVRIIQRQRKKEAARTGLHVSSIVQSLLKDLSPAKYTRDFPDETAFSYQEAGNVIEDLMARQLARRMKRWHKPDPRTFRGIVGSPDGYDPVSRTIDEIKVTWVSETDFFILDSRGHVDHESEKFMAYRLQFLFYALAFGARRVRLHVLFINGKYPRGGGPIPSARTFVFTFTQQELESNFQQLALQAHDARLPGWQGIEAA